jgi:hypothetical protein
VRIAVWLVAVSIAIISSAGCGRSGDSAPTAADLEALAEAKNVSTFRSALGEPTYQRTVKAANGDEDWQLNGWATKRYLVRALADTSGRVRMYAVSALADDLGVAIPHLRGQGGSQLRLGDSTFAEVDTKGLELVDRQGVVPPNGRWSYQEVYGNVPPRSRQVGLAASAVGAGSDRFPATVEPYTLDGILDKAVADRPDAAALGAWRSGATITTFAILDEDTSVHDLPADVAIPALEEDVSGSTAP